jgi:hypothetical protein
LFSFHFRFSAALENLPMAPRPFLGQGQQPVLVGACCGLVPKRSGHGRRLPRARPFERNVDLWARHLLSAEDLRERAEDLQNLPPERAGTAVE